MAIATPLLRLVGSRHVDRRGSYLLWMNASSVRRLSDRQTGDLERERYVVKGARPKRKKKSNRQNLFKI
jgi:hypothetical protein